jgi:hypothetical protein
MKRGVLMENNDDVFTRWMFEADGDPPDMGTEDNTEAPADDGPPDMPDNAEDSIPDDSGMDDGGFDDMNNDDYGDDDQQSSSDSQQEMHLSDKVNAIMNNQLYQRFLSLLNNIGSQLGSINANSDVLNTIMGEEYSELVHSLKKLDENVHLYLNNNFTHQDYSKNLLFFNMCLNLLKLLNDSFEDKVKKGIKKAE